MNELLWNAGFYAVGIVGGFASGYCYATWRIHGIARRHAMELLERIHSHGFDRPEPEGEPVKIMPRDIKKRATLGETPDYCRALPTAAEFAARKEEEWDRAAMRSPQLTAEDFRPGITTACPPTVRLVP